MTPMMMKKSVATLTLEASLKVMRPLIRMLVKRGVAYPAFAQALKTEFLAAAQRELQERQMPQTDSALSLLSGVHRRDVRNLTRPAEPKVDEAELARPLSLAAEVVGVWLNLPPFCRCPGPAARAAAQRQRGQLRRPGRPRQQRCPPACAAR